MQLFDIDVYSHGFSIRIRYPNERDVMMRFCQSLTIYEMVWIPKVRRKIRKPKTVFATTTPDRREFGFLIGDLEPLLTYLRQNGYRDEQWTIQHHRPSTGVPVDINVREGVGPRDEEQCKVMAFNTQDRPIRVMPLRTGGGKTVAGLMTAAHWRVRTALIMSAGYINNWLKSIEWVLDVKKSDVVVVKGRKQLVTLVELAQANQLEYKIIFLSINTLRDFLTDHLKEGYTINGVTPRMLFSTLGIGFRIIDESHENVHAVVRNTIHTHVNRTLYLSATIVSDNPMINERYDKIFPYEDRFKDGVNNDHCIGYWVHYDLASMDKIKYQGPRGYSHMLFEQSIRKDPKRLERFIELHVRYIDQYFLDDYLPGQKCLVFCAEVEMCEVMAAALKAVYRKRDLTVTSYTAKEDEEILYTHDIVVSTPGSAGTGKDIRNLKTGVTALNIDSTQKNLQMIGRFRVMHDFPDIHPRFIFMSCRSVDRQMEYGSRKMEYLQPHTHDLVVVDSGFTI